jgi:hypothetical protein
VAILVWARLGRKEGPGWGSRGLEVGPGGGARFCVKRVWPSHVRRKREDALLARVLEGR